MPDIQQYKARYPQYRYSIPQLLELSASAELSFDLSRFTYEAARAGVIPPLENCAMSSRRSSTSYMKAASSESMNNADLLVFQGNRLQHPARQPKLPPPAERQKDEGFAKFLKKHSSPTHNRVTAGGRIVPMEPRSPPAFSLSSVVPHQAQSVPDAHEIGVEKDADNVCAPAVQIQQQHPAIDQEKTVSPDRGSTNFLQYPAIYSDKGVPGLVSGYHAYGLAQPHMSSSHTFAPISMPSGGYMPDMHAGGPVMPQTMPHVPITYNGYYGSPGLTSVTAASTGLVSDPSWGTFEPIGPPQPDNSHPLLPAFQLLAAWEQHYVNLDVQLKNIDRHRAMHHLDPYLAEQRRIIVQQRSDAKDTVREYSRLLGVRRALNSSNDSFATIFNVEAPAYIPNRAVELAAMAECKPSNDHSSATGQVSSTEQPKTSSGRRPIPIVPPPEHNNTTSKPHHVEEDVVNSHDPNEFDEWGVQNRSAPPEVQREQSQLSDMLRAEQRGLSSKEDDEMPQICSSQTTADFPEDLRSGSISNNIGADSSTVITKVEVTDHSIPRDTAEEIQQVVDAIGKPKGTTTQVCLLDGRVINVEGQGIDLSSRYPVQPSGEKDWQKTTERKATPSFPMSIKPRDARKHATDIDQNDLIDVPIGKENAALAPRGHNKAATDAFLTQFNTIEDNVALATLPETRSLRTLSNGLLEERRSSGGHQIAAKSQMVRPSQGSTDRATTPSNADIAVKYEDLNNKSYSSISVQNIHVTGRLPQNFDGTTDAQAQLVAAEKARSPRLLKRHGINGSAWYGPYCREVFERARTQHGVNRPSRTQGSWRNN